MRLILYLFSLNTIGGVAFAQQPDWARGDTQRRTGSTLYVVCSAEAPALDLARKEALLSCQSTARQNLLTSAKVRSLSVQTEKEALFHEEVEENVTYTGLICGVEKESFEERVSSTKVWLLCRFDLSKAKAQATSSDDAQIDSAHKQSLGSLKEPMSKAQEGRYLSSDMYKAWTITTVPQCDELIIKGKISRVIKCTENPITISTQKDEKQIIVRARGYLPKTIHLGELGDGDDSIEVFLESY